MDASLALISVPMYDQSFHGQQNQSLKVGKK